MKETARRVIRFGVQNYLRNGWLSMAATMVVAMTLFIVSVFSLQSYVIKSATKSIQDKLDMAIYIKDGPSEDEVTAFLTDLRSNPEIREVVYLNKEQVIEEWNKLNVEQNIKSQVNAENNPLPRTVKIKPTDPTLLDGIVDKINASSFSANIRNISYKDNRPIIQQLTEQSRKTARNGIIVSSIFVIISVVFVYNTIRIIIRFRQEEISIMKLVGATDSFVRGPFIIEGALYGIIAGLITLVALYFYLQNGLSDSGAIIASSDNYIADQLFQFYQTYLPQIAGALIGVAIILAVFCSWISVHHHLKR